MELGLEVIRVSISVFLISLLYWLARLIPPALAGVVYFIALIVLRFFIAGWALFFTISGWLDPGWIEWSIMAVLWIVPALAVFDLIRMLVVKKRLFVGWQSVLTFIVLSILTFIVIYIPYRNLDQWIVGRE